MSLLSRKEGDGRTNSNVALNSTSSHKAEQAEHAAFHHCDERYRNEAAFGD